MKKPKCEHESGNVEAMKIVEFDVGETVTVLVVEHCNDCGKKIGEEWQVYDYSHSEDIE